MEDFINTAHWFFLPFGAFILVILVAIPGILIALFVALIKKTY